MLEGPDSDRRWVDSGRGKEIVPYIKGKPLGIFLLHYSNPTEYLPGRFQCYITEGLVLQREIAASSCNPETVKGIDRDAVWPVLKMRYEQSIQSLSTPPVPTCSESAKDSSDELYYQGGSAESLVHYIPFLPVDETNISQHTLKLDDDSRVQVNTLNVNALTAHYFGAYFKQYPKNRFSQTVWLLTREDNNWRLYFVENHPSKSSDRPRGGTPALDTYLCSESKHAEHYQGAMDLGYPAIIASEYTFGDDE